MMRAHTCFIVCATPRSGSALLCEALWNSRLAGRAEEYFNRESEAIWRARHGIGSTIDYLRWLMDRGTSSNAVFGAKNHVASNELLRSTASAAPGLPTP
jgi:LPS sulfotransferase NodH